MSSLALISFEYLFELELFLPDALWFDIVLSNTLSLSILLAREVKSRLLVRILNILVFTSVVTLNQSD